MIYTKNKTNIFLLSLVIVLCLGSCSKTKKTETVPVINNEKPVAVDDALSVEENSVAGLSNQINVSTNDKIGKDLRGSNAYSINVGATKGVVIEVRDGVFQYVPNPQFNGSDSFTYILTDINGNKAGARVTIKVVYSGPTAETFKNINPAFPSFVSVRNTTPLDKKWVKVESMSDEFNSWDQNKWFKSTWNYGVPVFMSTSNNNSGVTDGKLWIKATLNESNPEGRWFQSARIHSRTKINYPMYTEARIKTAHISAYNTYWMNNGNSTDRDEIDIIENNSKPSCGCQPDFPLLMNSQYFHANSSLVPVVIRNSDNFLNTRLSTTNPLRGVKWNEDYHTFGVWWKDSKNIQFYLNGEPAGSVVVGTHLNGTNYITREFTRDLEIIFDLWTADETWLGGLPIKADLSNNDINTMRIDWVRTWKLENK